MGTNQQENVVRPHSYDGIQEFDNALPRWWVGMFWFFIFFGIIYLIAFHIMGAPSLLDEYNKESAHYVSLQNSANQPGGGSGEGSQAALGGSMEDRLKDPQNIAEGKEIYIQNCLPCHGDQGQGVVGPNLTDKFWLHGGAPQNVIATISEGVPAKGMIAWKPILGQKKVEQVAAFVFSIQGTNPPNAKAPEGDEYKGN